MDLVTLLHALCTAGISPKSIVGPHGFSLQPTRSAWVSAFLLLRFDFLEYTALSHYALTANDTLISCTRLLATFGHNYI